MKKIFCLWLFCMGGLSFSQQSTEFFIERIIVDNKVQGAADLIVYQTRLNENETYSEDDLRAAMNRLQLLSFVIDANFKIERGSEKGKYQLRIFVRMQSRFFAQVRSRYTKFEFSEGRWSDVMRVGANYFFGKHSQVYASFWPGWTWFESNSGSNLHSGNIGYSNYHLFGSRLFFNIDLAFYESDSIERPAFGTITIKEDVAPSVYTSYYLGKNQWLQGSARFGETNQEVDSDDGLGENFISRTTNRYYTLEWERNTTDDSWEATRGSKLEVGARRLDNKSENLIRSSRSSSRRQSLAVEYERFHPLNFRNVLSYRGRARYEESDSSGSSNFDSQLYEAAGGYKVQLFSSLTQYRLGDAFAGTEIEQRRFESDSTSLGNTEVDSTRLELFLTYRGRWGLIRLEAAYIFEN